MQKTTDRLKRLSQSQLDLTQNLCSLSLECCERLTEIHGQSARALLAQGETNGASWLHGDGTGLMLANARIALDYWSAAIDCGMAFQRQVLTGLAKK